MNDNFDAISQRIDIYMKNLIIEQKVIDIEKDLNLLNYEKKILIKALVNKKI